MVVLKVWCLVDDKSSSNAFPVDADASATIGDLKKAIKDQNTETFKEIDAKDLTLWCVKVPITPVRKITLSLPNEQETATTLSRLNLNEDQQATIAQCRLNDEPIHLIRLNLSEGQKAAITRSQMKEDEVVDVTFLADPSMTISDEDAFGTGSLPPRNIHVIVQPPLSDFLRTPVKGPLPSVIVRKRWGMQSGAPDLHTRL
ncbi:hypothetical protein B0O80DRAFT_243960 [Mortierella sp. GBAus27b]|nr:hypothetical protein B0O80DRAFT_243960 [Mortierella sp. GBAus27b]